MHGVSASPRDQGQRMDTQQTLEDLVYLKGVLQDLRAHISMTLLVWKDFSRVDGHISFFSDMTGKDANISLERIKQSFTQLELLEQKLSLLCRHCTDSAGDVGQLVKTLAFVDHHL